MSRSQPRRSIALDVLLEDERDSTPAHIADAAEKSFDAIPGGKLIPIDHIDTWERQPRKSFDEEGITELAASIADTGVLEPLVVRRNTGRPGHYTIIAGHRRLLAARRVYGSEAAAERARVETLPCVIREATDDTAFADALVENLVRKDLTRREMMDAVTALKDEYGWSVRAIARRTGRNQHDLSVLARIAADKDLSQLVADNIISPTALGVLVEEKHTPVRGAVIEDIRAGRLKTVGDVEDAVKAAHATLEASTQSHTVSDITHPAAPHDGTHEGAHDRVGVSDITHPTAPETTVVDHVESLVKPGKRHDAGVSINGEALGRTIPVQAHERRIGPNTDNGARFERVLADSLAAIRSCLPLDAADKAKGQAFAAELLTLMDRDA